MIKIRAKTDRGIALVIVLGCLVILSALILSFLSTAGTELKSSRIYADSSSVRLNAQSAVNMVVAEIREATQTRDSGGALSGTWASQPGMIRTYKNDGSPDRYFKLYSDADMVGMGRFDCNAAGLALATWSTDRAIYTDLNEPITMDGINHYPILSGDNLTSVAGAPGKTYDADGNGKPDVEGFHVDNAPESMNPVPMPVRWLYVLASGEVVSPTGSGTTAIVAGASSSNPIVGRMAFWTDDETSKININTASEGSYWDTPRVSSNQDQAFALRQPAQHEYQRYAGHPAMTSLSTVFGQLAAGTGFPENFYPMTPRYMPGGSKGGSVAPTGPLTPASSSPGVGSNRLYASIDEFLFQPDRRVNSPQIDRRALEQAKFFITASSRAPDLNLFGKPRVCLWPVHKDESANHTTAFDRLIAFCSKVNKHLYYFQRENPTSPTHDLPVSASANGLGRNRMLLEYIRSLSDQSFPGFGGTFKSKYGAKDRDQILTQLFDYIRSINLDDPGVKTPFNVKVMPAGGTSQQNHTRGNGQVVPIVDATNDTRGFGRFPTIQGAFLQFIGRPAPAPAPPVQTQVQAIFYVNLFDPSLGHLKSKPYFKLRVTGLDSLQWSGVNNSGLPIPLTSMGFPGVGIAVPTHFHVWGEHGFGGMMNFYQFSLNQSGSGGTPNLTDHPASHPYQLISGNMNMPAQAASGQPNSFFQFQGGDIKIEMLAPDGNDTVLQSVTLSFPAPNPTGQMPVPLLAPTLVDGYNFQTFRGGRLIANDTSKSAAQITSKDVVRAVIPTLAGADMRLVLPRSTIQPADGFFMTHSLYHDKIRLRAHSLRNNDNQAYFGATSGRLLHVAYHQWQSAPYTHNNESTGMTNVAPRDSPLIPAGSTAEILGDWDNGVGPLPDGPYINKADEGDNSGSGSGNDVAYYTAKSFSVGTTLFSPNRMMPSAGMFGSLPTGVWANKPWQTLLFNPYPLAGSSHPGFGSPASSVPPYSKPPDHLLLDLFNMPVVEPYAISEPLSTAGRINMNYQIVPFAWIHRDTGIRAILKSEKIIAIPDNAASTYKQAYKANSGPDVRLAIDADQTLQGFRDRFNNLEVFRSPTEICGLPLVPVGTTWSGITAFWNDKRLTGDNSRERPYTTIYPRLTTKSNTFTVHVRVQTLKKLKSDANQQQWREGIDQVTGEFRGSQTIERFVDPNDPTLPDFADLSVTQTIDSFYKFRVVSSKQFCP